jgi:ATPase subunit of ABC transporter with duplicated ATPase domains
MRKLMLALGILENPELIIMDEPTNHLDLGSVEALERVLAAYPGALLLVSHDAALLGATTGIMWRIGRVGADRLRLVVC